jgi:hypothetical protein
MKAKVTFGNTNKPNAWIVSTQDHGRKSIKNGKNVYLQDNSEFKVELFNPLFESVLADIKVNGKSVSSTGLVLRPGERFYLDCFLDDKKKFIFKTYEVEKTNESLNAIQNNGTVEVYFYKEETINFKNWKNRFDHVIEHRYYPVWYPNPYYVPTYPTYPTYPTWSGINTTGGCFNNVNTTNTVFTTTLNPGVTYTNGSNTIGCVNTNSVNCFHTSTSDTLKRSGTSGSAGNGGTTGLETGRIEKGDISSQQFSDIDMEFEKYHISSVMYQILPESQKPVETKEIRNNFCTSCECPLKATMNFCPNCGEKA